jgi:hypothetical protein
MAEVMRAAVSQRVGVKFAQQRPRREDVVAHRRVDALRLAWHGRRFGLLFVKSQDRSIRRGLDDAKLRRQAGRDRHSRDRHFSAHPFVKLDHLANIHPVDVVRAKDGHQMLIRVFDEVDVLINGVGRALVPGLSGRAHLCRNRNDEMILQQRAELPTIAKMP